MRKLVPTLKSPRPASGAGQPVVAQDDDPEAGFLAWLLGAYPQDAPAGDVPAGQDAPVRKLATRLAGCVAAGCVAGTDRFTVFDVAAHVGGHSRDGRLPSWIVTALRLAVIEHEASRCAADQTSEVTAVCGECGRWQTEAQFEATGGCCSRRAVDYDNVWPGRGRRKARTTTTPPKCESCGELCTHGEAPGVVDEAWWECRECREYGSFDYPHPPPPECPKCPRCGIGCGASGLGVWQCKGCRAYVPDRPDSMAPLGSAISELAPCGSCGAPNQLAADPDYLGVWDLVTDHHADCAVLAAHQAAR